MDEQPQLQSPPNSFFAPLLELRDYYAPIVEKYEKLYTQALSNLNHVEALLSVWSDNDNLPDLEVISKPVASNLENLPWENNDSTPKPIVNSVEPDTVSSQIPATKNSSSAKQNVKPPIVITEAALSISENFSLSNSDVYYELRLPTSEASGSLVEYINSEVAPTNDLELETPFEEFPKIENSSTVTEVVTSAPEGNSDRLIQPPVELVELIDFVPKTSESQEEDDDLPESTDTDTPEEAPEKSLSWSEIPMLPEYQSLNRTEAILKVLQKYAGSVCHISLIMRSLYGDLQPEALKVVKGRVHSSLTHGKESGKWSLVPGKPGCYTLDLKLLNSNRSSSSSKQSKNQKPSSVVKTNLIPMVEEFSGQVLIDAISSLLQQNPCQTFTIAKVINGLCGEVDSQEFNQIKSKVLKELSRGHRTGRFSRVPGEIGLYTWDSKLLPANAS
jgi:hypothetical protein